MGTLPAGDYRTTEFRPTLLFTLPVTGWREFFEHDSDEIALDGDNAEIAVTRPSHVVDPELGVIDTPENMSKWLASNPRLGAGEPVATHVAGIKSSIVDISGPADTVEIFAYPTGNMRAPAGIASRFIVVPMDGPDLIIVIHQPEGGGTLEDAIAATQSIVDSLAIVP